MHRAKLGTVAIYAVALNFGAIGVITLLLKLTLISIPWSILHATPHSTGSSVGIRQGADGDLNPRIGAMDDPSVEETFFAPNFAPAKVILSSTFADKPRVRAVAGATKAESTLVLYLYASGDKFSRGNLDFFIKHGIKEGDGLDYIIIVQKGGKTPLAGLPALPTNARYVLHANKCYDWGAYTWAINATTGLVDISALKYFIFVNSSVRGPFLPAYWPASIHWTTAFTSRLSSEVKLVGSSISCGRIHRHNDKTQPFRSNPHVQSYAMATDRVGLRVLQNNGKVFKCHNSTLDTIWDAEIGASAAILAADYNIDCLLTKYQGVNWRNSSYANCNKGMNPTWERHYDGIGLNPLEQMFVKVNSMCLDEELCSTSAKLALAYDRFINKQGDAQSVGGNALLDNAKSCLDMEGALDEAGRQNLTAGLEGCFDLSFYLKNNGDLRKIGAKATAHFAHDGRFELQRDWHIKSTPNCSISMVVNRASKEVMATFSSLNI